MLNIDGTLTVEKESNCMNEKQLTNRLMSIGGAIEIIIGVLHLN